jgi:pilus assembly protein CpaB
MLVDTAEELSATGSNAALQVPRGMVAFSIPINRLSAVSYAPQPGDHVNVIVSLLMLDLDTEFQSRLPNLTIGVTAPGTTLTKGTTGSSGKQESGTSSSEGSGEASIEVQSSVVVAVPGGGGAPLGRAELDTILNQTYYVVPSEDQRPRLVSQSLLQDVIVLGVGDFPYGDQLKAEPTPVAAPVEGQGQNEATPTPAPPPSPPDVITLIVNPQDAVTLNYLIYSGSQLTLALRASGDDSRVQTEAVTLQFLLDQYKIPVPVKLPYGMEPRVNELQSPSLPNDIRPTPRP